MTYGEFIGNQASIRDLDAQLAEMITRNSDFILQRAKEKFNGETIRLGVRRYISDIEVTECVMQNDGTYEITCNCSYRCLGESVDRNPLCYWDYIDYTSKTFAVTVNKDADDIIIATAGYAIADEDEFTKFMCLFNRRMNVCDYDGRTIDYMSHVCLIVNPDASGQVISYDENTETFTLALNDGNLNTAAVNKNEIKVK